MEIKEAKSAIKAVYLQAASMAGFEVGPQSPEGLAALVDDGFAKVTSTRRPEAVANLLRVIAATLDYAQANGSTMLHETDVEGGRQRVCPVYPFGGPASAKKRQVVSGHTGKKLRRRG